MSLVSHDPMGELLSGEGNVSIEDTATLIHGMAQQANMNTESYFELYLVLFQADGGSYTHDADPDGFGAFNHSFAFNTEDGSMRIVGSASQKVEELRTYIRTYFTDTHLRKRKLKR